MKEHKGQNTSICGLFLGFICYLTGIFADRLNVYLPQDKDVLRFSNHAPMRDPDASASVTEWRSAPGFPFSLKSAAQSCRAR